MKRKQSGFTILEMIVVLMVMVAAISAGSAYMKKNADNNLNQTAAANLQKLAQAVKWYAKDNYATLKSAGETTLSIADLIDNKYLEEGFSKVNSYGQRYTISIQPDAKNSELLQLRIITENGSVIATENMKKIAGMAGSDAGYATTTNTITGNQQGWSLGGQEIMKGHLASVSYVSGKDIVSAESFLRRDKFDGHPEWNQMNTDLTMTKSSSIIAESDKGNAVLDGQQLVFNDLDTNYTASLSDKTLTFNNSGATGSLSSDELYLAKGSNKTSVADNQISVTDGRNTTTIKSDSITTKNVTADGTIQGETIIGDQMISRSYETSTSTSKDPGGRLRNSIGMFSEATPNYLKIPFIHTDYYWSHSSADTIANDAGLIAKRMIGCNTNDLTTQGRMVMVGSNTVGHKVVLICSESSFKLVQYLD
ncbi:shufflon system plasmid conjugative transfer pilus tip adhesin PilV [Enterobacteriaceae bacterium H20N1]|uniref:Shufflon system plasmid conjugative transfer pilus tip adhesin PilV n=2 Tax=Dryocola boscaweniae TaxID=2925397 RepID=A0A9X2W3X7_9ENTR|nr:shufflon system plasmid conjugative transfer pilus tip adhesin PilV [Dryocola boscaweniae]MCT4700496.1 shufflon system plasmid conjugative transfer pilus tip adhesin PilV [Dryocola boscaweniae]MCT4717652.1 shufflon system plasmid conjugative transfer pilus tip adhesin PilV [Dryocola boscaweniae]